MAQRARENDNLPGNVAAASAFSVSSTDVLWLGLTPATECDRVSAGGDRVLKARLGGKHLRFTDAERCRLAEKRTRSGGTVLTSLTLWVTPDTPLRWYRKLIALNGRTAADRSGPSARDEDNRRSRYGVWHSIIRPGDTRALQGALANLDIRLDAARSPTFSKKTGSIPLRSRVRTPDGPRF